MKARILLTFVALVLLSACSQGSPVDPEVFRHDSSPTIGSGH